MSMTVEQMTKIFRLVMDDVELNRLLYYKTDPLSPFHPDVQSLENYYVSTNDSPAIINTIFKRAPKTDDLSDSPLCRMCVYLGNALPKPTNQSAMLLDQDLMIDVSPILTPLKKLNLEILRLMTELINSCSIRILLVLVKQTLIKDC